MKKLLSLLATVAVLAFGIQALASASYKATLTNTSASTNSAAVYPHLDYVLDCNVPSLYATGTSTVTVSLTTALPLDAYVSKKVLTTTTATTGASLVVDAGVASGQAYSTNGSAATTTSTDTYRYKTVFNAGSSTLVAARAADDGAITCYLYQLTK